MSQRIDVHQHITDRIIAAFERGADASVGESPVQMVATGAVPTMTVESPGGDAGGPNPLATLTLVVAPEHIR